jgi:hypothetical protein
LCKKHAAQKRRSEGFSHYARLRQPNSGFAALSGEASKVTMTKAQMEDLVSAPESIVSLSLDVLYGLSRSEYQDLQLMALRARFAQLRGRVPALTKLADGLGVVEIEALERGAQLLFQHIVYKSYPLALIERNDFARLTAWLDRLTTHDLSHLDVAHIEFIDDWLKYLDNHTALRVVHSTGTSGKLSFLPRSTTEMPAYVKGMLSFYAGFKDEPDLTPKGMSLVIPAYRHGFNAGPRMVQAMMDELHIEESDCLALYDFVSSDLMSLAGRLRTAEAKGEGGKLVINDHMKALRRRLMLQKAGESEAFEAFFERAIAKFRSRRVWLMSTVPQLYRAAEFARSRGLTHVFDANSIVHTGGGMKGAALPTDFMQTICDFVGVNSVREAYGMTEMMTFMPKCPHGYYHVPPQLIPYVIDPESGVLQPQSGVQRGRFGFIDLLAQTYWGGFLTGDAITLDWDLKCRCGRSGGPVLHGTVERLSEKLGGDDKISCAGGADAAHDTAVEFLLNEL